MTQNDTTQKPALTKDQADKIKQIAVIKDKQVQDNKIIKK